jgi:hypothetical protein
MSKNTPTRERLRQATPDGVATNVERYECEPLNGYAMLNWRGKRPFTSTQYYMPRRTSVIGRIMPILAQLEPAPRSYPGHLRVLQTAGPMAG